MHVDFNSNVLECAHKQMKFGGILDKDNFVGKCVSHECNQCKI